jgi:hypothetical protein
VNNSEIDDLLKRREAAVVRLTAAQGRLGDKIATLGYEARLAPEFRRHQIDVLRLSLRQVEEEIDKLEQVIEETDPVFDEVAARIG